MRRWREHAIDTHTHTAQPDSPCPSVHPLGGGTARSTTPGRTGMQSASDWRASTFWEGQGPRAQQWRNHQAQAPLEDHSSPEGDRPADENLLTAIALGGAAVADIREELEMVLRVLANVPWGPQAHRNIIHVLQGYPPLVAHFQRLLLAMNMLRSLREDLGGAINILAAGLLGPSAPTWPDDPQAYTGGIRPGDDHHRYRWKRRRQNPPPDSTEGAGGHSGLTAAALQETQEQETGPPHAGDDPLPALPPGDSPMAPLPDADAPPPLRCPCPLCPRGAPETRPARVAREMRKSEVASCSSGIAPPRSASGTLTLRTTAGMQSTGPRGAG